MQLFRSVTSHCVNPAFSFEDYYPLRASFARVEGSKRPVQDVNRSVNAAQGAVCVIFSHL
jgi:hypothetical protein